MRDISEKGLSRLLPEPSEADELTKLVETHVPHRPRYQSRAQVIEDVQRMSASKNWDDAGPAHLVELVGALHEHVYGVEAEELRGKSRAVAIRNASSLLKLMSIVEAVEYITWAWKREQEREVWRRANNRGNGRLSVIWVFVNTSLRTEYKIHVQRQRHRM